MGLDALIESRRHWASARRREGVEGVYKAQAIALPLPPSFHDAVRVPRAERAVVVGYKRRAGPGAPPFDIEVGQLAARAEAAGACAIAIWPDDEFHGGSYHDILAAAQATSLPVLSRDPVVDPVQIVMARAHGAAAVTIDVAHVGDDELRALFRQAIDLGLDVLVEASTALELERVASFRLGSSEASGARVVGVSALDAAGRADAAQYLRLAPGVPEFAAAIATTGIASPEDLRAVEAAGFDACIVAEPLLLAGIFEAEMERFAGPPL